MKLTLRAARTITGLTAEEVATIAGVSRNTIAKYETDASKANIEYLKKILSVYGLGLDEIELRSEKDVQKVYKEMLKEAESISKSEKEGVQNDDQTNIEEKCSESDKGTPQQN